MRKDIKHILNTIGYFHANYILVQRYCYNAEGVNGIFKIGISRECSEEKEKVTT